MDYEKLKDELVAGHPTTGAYSVVDATALTEIQALNRPISGTVGAMIQYLINKKHRTNQGGDTTYTPIVGRLEHVARSDSGGDPFDRTSGGYTGLDAQHIHACVTFLELFRSQHLESLDFSDANLPYGFVEASGAWSTTHTAALKTFSENLQSRETELGFPVLKVDDITYARAL